MRSRLFLPLALVAVLAGGLAVAACSDQASPTAPDPTEGLVPAGIADAQTIQEIRRLFKNRLFALGFYASIRIAAFVGNDQVALDRTLEFLRFSTKELAAGRVRAPNDGRTREEGVTDLFNRIFDELGVDGPNIDAENLASGEFVIARVGPGGGKVTVPSRHAAIAFASGDLSANTWVVIALLPNPTSPGACPFGFPVDGDCYPLFYDYELFPESNLSGTPRIGQCVVDTGPFAPPPGVEAGLVIASEDHESPGTLILWPEAEAPTTVNCSDLAFAAPDDWRTDLWAALGPVGRLFEVRPAWANPGKLGASISSFSPFAPFDAGGEEPPPPEGVIRGEVVEFGEPVEGAVVNIDGPVFRSDTTDAEGLFRFDDVPYDPEGTDYAVFTEARQGADQKDVTLSLEDPEAVVTLDISSECCSEVPSSRAPAAD